MSDIPNDRQPGQEGDARLTTADLAAASSRQQTPPETRTFTLRDDDGQEREAGPLFASEEAEQFRGRWTSIQASFVDEPRRAVEQADSLVADTIKRMAEMFAEERSRLEGQWDKGDDVSTEDLRQALRRYRSFFGRLLSV